MKADAVTSGHFAAQSEQAAEHIDKPQLSRSAITTLSNSSVGYSQAMMYSAPESGSCGLAIDVLREKDF